MIFLGRTAGIVIGVLAMVICIIVVPLACICRDRCKRKRESQAAPRRSSEPAPPVNLWGDAPEPTRAYTRNDELGILTRAERNRRIMVSLLCDLKAVYLYNNIIIVYQ